MHEIFVFWANVAGYIIKSKQLDLNTQNYPMKKSKNSFWLMLTIVSLVVLASAQNNSQGTIDTLALGTFQTVFIQATKTKTLSLTIDTKITEKQSLYITAQSPFNDPFEQPQITVTSDNGFSLSCYEQSNDFMGICQIQRQQLKEKRVFKIQLYCEVDCELQVSAYLSEAYQTQIGDTFTLRNLQKIPMAQPGLIQIPSEEQFTQIMIVAAPVNLDQQVEATVMVANYGQNPIPPTNEQYMIKAQSTSGHRLGIFLSSAEVKPGDKIYLLVIVPANAEVQITSKVVNKNVYKLFIGSPLYDFTTNAQARTYVLDLQQFEEEQNSTNSTFEETVQIKFMSFSGSPTVLVAFDPEFSQQKRLQSYDGEEASSYEITESIRKEKEYTGKIYINVTSFWSSNYYLQAFVNRKPFIDMQPQVAQLIRIQPQSLKNLIFTDQNYDENLEEDGIVDYKITVKISQNKVDFMIRDCGSFKDGNVMDCIIKNTSDLQKEDNKKSFSSIQYTKDFVYDTYIIKFSYNVTDKCVSVASGTPQKKYICTFHLVLRNPDESAEVFTSIEMVKNSIIRQLREGISDKSTVMKGQMSYFSFYLPSVENISALQFFTTVIQGDISIMVSTTLKYPSMSDLTNANDIAFSIFNSVLIQEKDLKVGTYYIGVYGYSMTDFSIGVAVSRKKSSSTSNTTDVVVTQIILQKGQTQTYTMPTNKTVAKFVFTPSKQNELSLIKINQMQGDVTYTISDKNQPSVVVCDSVVLSTNEEDYCEFKSTIDHTYVVTVEGFKDQTQLFSILYTTEDICDSYPWNYPVYINLNKNESSCFTYSLYDLQDIHVSLGLSSLQTLTSKIQIDLKFGEKTLNITNRQKIITKSELQLLCTTKSSCSFTVQVKNVDTTPSFEKNSISFLIAVQTFGNQNVLFDGLATKIVTDKISTTTSQKFFYYVFNPDLENGDLCIFFSSQTASKYQIAATLVKNSEFVKDFAQQLYPKFNDQSNKTIVVNSSQLAPITLLKLDKQKILADVTYVDLSVVLISVFGIPPESQSEPSTYVFKIEVSMGSSRLELGDSKVGFVQKDTIFEYQIDISSGISSSIEVRQMDSLKCVKTYIVDSSTKNSTLKQFNQAYTFGQDDSGKRSILIKTNLDTCAFQISYNSLSVPITTAQTTTPYQISISNDQVKYFSYYHTNKQSFYILQMISAGSSYIYATKIGDNNVETLLKKDVKTFDFAGQMNGDLYVANTDANFCFNCYYIIAVQGFPDVQGEMTINPSDIPILLKDGAIMRDRLQLNENITYQLYSSSSFNISVSPLYGSVQVVVTDPSSKVVSNQTVGSQQLITVPAPQSASTNGDYYNDKSRYLITVKSKQTTSYFITIKTKDTGKTIFEGVPATIELSSSQSTAVQFYNAHPTGTINILVEDLKFYQSAEKSHITFTATQGNSQNLIKKLTSSESSINIQLQATKGTYSLAIQTNRNTTISLIFAKNDFTHLTAGSTFLMNQPAIFEIFSPGDSVVIEIYPCNNDVSVQASSNFSKLISENASDEGIVRMEHANYGGHYVITAENLKGEYFISADRESDEDDNNELKYIITYHLYSPSKGEKMPYKVYGLASQQIRYKYSLGGVEFILSRVSRKDDLPMQGNITYKLYISNDSTAIGQMTKCSLGQVYTSTQVIPAGKRGMVSFKFDTKTIKQIIGNSQSYLVGAEATIYFDQQNKTHISEANFVYEVTQLLLSNTQKVETVVINNGESKFIKYKNIALWIILPFLVGSVLLFFAARYLLRSFSAYPTQLIEEEAENHGPSEGNLHGQKSQTGVQAK